MLVEGANMVCYWTVFCNERYENEIEIESEISSRSKLGTDDENK